MKRLGTLGALSLATALWTCDSGPEAGELVAQLVTGRNDVGAVAFAITALEPNTVAGVTADCAGCQVHIVAVGEREVRGIVVGNALLAAGPVFRVTVSDVKEPLLYAARVLEAAADDLSAVPLSELRVHLVAP